jgi:hypothetical protein
MTFFIKRENCFRWVLGDNSYYQQFGTELGLSFWYLDFKFLLPVGAPEGRYGSLLNRIQSLGS